MARFLTRRYVAVSWPEAIRLATLDGTPLAAIRVSPTAELLHRTEWWAWWSDEQLTTAIALPESLSPEGLSADAVALISEVWEGDAPTPQCGWSPLANIERILSQKRINLARPASDQTLVERVTRLTIEFRSRERGTLYRYDQFGEEHYLCDVSWVLSSFLPLGYEELPPECSPLGD